jgi:hypothetical protein
MTILVLVTVAASAMPLLVVLRPVVARIFEAKAAQLRRGIAAETRLGPVLSSCDHYEVLSTAGERLARYERLVKILRFGRPARKTGR